MSKFIDNGQFHGIPHRNVIVTNLSSKNTDRLLLNHLFKYHETIERIVFKFCRFQISEELFEILKNLIKLNEVIFDHCSIQSDISPENYGNRLSSLKSVSFNECQGNLYTFFQNHKTIEKIVVISHKNSWIGFPHEDFDKLANSLPKLKHIKFEGEGTGSFFDRSEFNFKIEILEVEIITFHWYIGISGARNKFLISQKENLKELRLKKLPHDFDGGRVFKFIMEQMNLETFYYGDIPLILKRKKQIVRHISTNETQIEAAFEMFRQFPGMFT